MDIPLGKASLFNEYPIQQSTRNDGEAERNKSFFRFGPQNQFTSLVDSVCYYVPGEQRLCFQHVCRNPNKRKTFTIGHRYEDNMMT